MIPKIEKYLSKHNIRTSNIKYILRENGKTCIYVDDGRVLQTYHTIKEFRESLPVDQFYYPNKGILVAADQIVDIHGGAYTTADGRSFKYRVHNSQLHDMRLLDLGRRIEHLHTVESVQTLSTEHFYILEHMPLPVCIIERVTQDPESVGRFLFRYCNRALLEFEGLARDDILGKALTEVFPHATPGSLISYVDVALNGTVRILEEFNAAKNIHVKLYCYQPAPGYCVCVMTEHDAPSAHTETDPSCVSVLG